MPYDLLLADRVRESIVAHLGPTDELTERKMFGGVCFLLGGRMAAGVETERIMLRLETADLEPALSLGVLMPMDFTGKQMNNFAFLRSRGLSDEQLDHWIELSMQYARNQPPPQPRKPRTPKSKTV